MGSVKHKFTCPVPDDAAAVAAGQVVPSNWNDSHDITLVASDVNAAPIPHIGASAPANPQQGQFWIVTQ
jgi:hypothetical protein